MARVRQSGTAPELVVRQLLRSMDIAYRIGGKGLPGRPDLCNRRRGWAIFVHGCYWHQHTGCSRATTPKNNASFWAEKFVANRRRDARAVRDLRRMGLRVLIVWECEVKNDRAGAKLRRFFAQPSEGQTTRPSR